MSADGNASDDRSTQRQRAASRARRLRHVVFAVCATIALLFVAATASYVRPYGVMGVGPQRWWALGFVGGELTFLRGDSGGVLPQGVRLRTDKAWPRTARGANGQRVKLPYAIFASMIGFAVAGFTYQTRAAQLRAKSGLCRACEYDLRGLDVVDGHKTCPECGTRKRTVVKIT